MRNFGISLLLLSGFVILGGCGKSTTPTQETASSTAPTSPAAATPSDLPAHVELNDGTRYTGVLVSKSGSQMTFRGDNGATRTFDSQDIKSIRFESSANPTDTAKNMAPAAGLAPAPAPTERPRPAQRMASPDSTSAAADTAPAQRESRRAPVERTIVIPAGTQLQVRTNENIDSKTADTGQTFSADIAQSVMDDSGRVAIPKNSNVELVIRQAGAGKIHANDLVLDMQSVTVAGNTYQVDTADISQQGKQGVGVNKRSGKYMGGAPRWEPSSAPSRVAEKEQPLAPHPGPVQARPRRS